MKAATNKLAYVGSKPGQATESARDSDRWFTPLEYIQMAMAVMGTIDLDPYSCDSANTKIGAKKYFDLNRDALEHSWFEEPGTVFMNPPYGRGLIESAADRFLKHWHGGQISQGIVLVNNATETKWFQSLLGSSTALCLPNRRIAFINDDGKNISSNTRGQAFFYFGARDGEFKRVFGTIGAVLCVL